MVIQAIYALQYIIMVIQIVHTFFCHSFLETQCKFSANSVPTPNTACAKRKRPFKGPVSQESANVLLKGQCHKKVQTSF